MKSGFIAGKAEESGARPSLHVALLLQAWSRAPSSASRPALPPALAQLLSYPSPTLAGVMWGYPSLSPAWGASQPPAHMPQSSFPSPKASQHGRAPGSRPSLHKALIPQPKGSVLGSCINHPPVQLGSCINHPPVSPDTESPNKGAGAATSPLPVRLSFSAFPVAPTQTGPSAGHCWLQDPADRAATASSSWNPTARHWGWGQGLSLSLARH